MVTFCFLSTLLHLAMATIKIAPMVGCHKKHQEIPGLTGLAGLNQYRPSLLEYIPGKHANPSGHTGSDLAFSRLETWFQACISKHG